MSQRIDSLGCTQLQYQGVFYELTFVNDQCWFAENLRATKYNNDVVIPSGLDNAAWYSTTDGAMTIYDEGGANEATNLETYGRLYNWYAVNTGNLCPSGWHVPSDEEWTAFTDYLGGESVGGGKMKSSSSDTPAWNGWNGSGFSGLPGGYRGNQYAYFYSGGEYGYWWSSTSSGSNSAWYRTLGPGNGVYRSDVYYKGNGRSVRCVRDE